MNRTAVTTFCFASLLTAQSSEFRDSVIPSGLLRGMPAVEDFRMPSAEAFNHWFSAAEHLWQANADPRLQLPVRYQGRWRIRSEDWIYTELELRGNTFALGRGPGANTLSSASGNLAWHSEGAVLLLRGSTDVSARVLVVGRLVRSELRGAMAVRIQFQNARGLGGHYGPLDPERSSTWTLERIGP